MSSAKRNKAIEECETPDGSFTLHENVRILHSYNSLIIARANAQKAEDTSSLDTENEEFGRNRKRKPAKRTIASDTEDEDEPLSKRSKFPSAPLVQKSLQNKMKDKLQNQLIGSTSSKSSKKNSPKVDISGHSPLQASSISKNSSTSSTGTDLSRQSPGALSCGTSQMMISPALSFTFSPLPSSSKKQSDRKVEFSRSQSSCRRGLTFDCSGKESVIKIGQRKIDTKQLSQAEYQTIVSLQVEIRNRLDSMEKLLNYVLRALKPSQKLVIPKELPDLPLRDMENFERTEEFIADSANRAETTEFLSKYISASQSVKECTYILLRKIMTDTLASSFNWKGTGTKKGFRDCKLNSVMVGALLDSHKNTPDVLKDAENAVKDWLKCAPKRSKKSSAALSANSQSV
ncbi:ADP-ribosylation factor-binding protein GGA1 [Frankliniella fusca]|uniref:ADP-ribosylation factor-binding protein GGA1 n=1 Tax=Frankliniella fusca TaxID=407009 RepID=A0AAE1LIY1_9NEOP|nr:ADP-ribosylation factor-binding protein GGA1 [Frankliniella fusca]